MKLSGAPNPMLLLWVLLITLASGNAMAEDEAVAKYGNIVVAADVFDLHLDFDTTLDILGDTRFFSSRHNNYVGGRFMVHSGEDVNKTFYIAPYMGFVWGKSSFLMNWEEPGLLSFDPLESRITTFSWAFGFDANLYLGSFLRISPYASAKMMLLHMSMDVSDESYSDTAYKLGVDVGLRVALNFGIFSLTGGAGLTHIINDEIDFELDDLKFRSKTSGSSPEYFLGMEF